MNFNFADLAFVIVAIVSLFGALGVVISRNIVHSALFLVLTFIGVSGLFFNLGAGFLGLIQILVYAGAISVLFIFAVMLVMNVDADKTNTVTPGLGTHLWGIYIAATLTIVLALSIWFSHLTQVVGDVVKDTVGALASLMLGDYVVAFEVAAVLLLMAVVGAIILAKGAEEQ